MADPGTLAYQLIEHVADTVGEEVADDYLAGVVDELFVLVPGFMQHFSDALLGELKEEVLRDDTDFAYALHNAIVEIETKWRNDG